MKKVYKFSIVNKIAKKIGITIIDFLSQIEDFQKRLWEKEKLVLRTEYVITLDRIKEYAGDDFLNEVIKEVLKNEEQLNEWRELGFGEVKNKDDLLLKNNLLEKTYKKLPIDTKYFSENFKEKLLEKLTEKYDLDDILDGLLIKSENWQALNWLLNKYKEKVQTIYIDPPYNTGSDGFLYRDRYQHSSWLTMMENRLSLAKELMREDGVIFVSIGDLIPQNGESYRLQFLLSSVFSKRFGNLIWKKRPGIGSFSERDMTENHEYICVYGKEKSFIYNNLISDEKLKEYSNKDDKGVFRWMELVGPSQQTKEKRPNLNYGVIYDIENDKIVGFEFYEGKRIVRDFFDNAYSQNLFYIWLPGKATWLISKSVFKEYYDKGLIKVFKVKESKFIPRIKKYLHNPDGSIDGDILKSILTDNKVEVGMNIEATKMLNSLFPDMDTKQMNPKPVTLIKLLIHTTTIKNSLIFDFFAGSGTTAHAVMKLNKEDGGKRKFILVEMADYFDTVIIPRIKKVAYSFNWKNGKPQDTDGIGVFFKYQILEQYEDTLDEYLLKYIIED